MDKQNSKGYNNCRFHPFAILQHGIEVKKDIQNEIFGLIAILKKREHDLCLEVDQQCLELLCEAEELGMCGANVLNYPNHEVDESIQCIKKQDSLPSKLKFTGDLNNCQQTLKSYGNLEKIDSRKNVMCNGKTNDQLPERLIEWVKTVQENLEEKKYINKLENASCCSADSLGVLAEKKIREQNYCHSKLREIELKRNVLKGLMDSVDKQANWDKSFINEQDASLRDSVEEIYGLMMDRVQCDLENKRSPEVVLEAQLNNKRPFCLPSAYQRSNSRMLNTNEWLAEVAHECPGTTTDECCDMLSEISVTPATSKSYPGNSAAKVAGGDNPQNSIKACFGAYLKQNDLKLWLSPNQSSNEMNSTLYEEPTDLWPSPSSSASSELYAYHSTEVAGGDNPQDTIKACFGSYLKQTDLKLWLSPNHSSLEMDITLYEEWLEKNSTLSLIEDEIKDPCAFNGSCHIPVHVTQEMADSFCLIKPRNR